MISELELAFHKAMVDIYHRAKDEAGYNATRYIQMVGNRGGTETARALINAEAPSDGYTALWELDRLDLTVEALVVKNPEWHPLFTPTEISKAEA